MSDSRRERLEVLCAGDLEKKDFYCNFAEISKNEDLRDIRATAGFGDS